MGARELIKSAVAFHAQDSSTFTEYAHTCLACLYEVKSEELLAPYQRLRKLATERQQKARAMVLPGDSPSTSRSGTPASQSSNFAGVGMLPPAVRRSRMRIQANALFDLMAFLIVGLNWTMQALVRVPHLTCYAHRCSRRRRCNARPGTPGPIPASGDEGGPYLAWRINSYRWWRSRRQVLLLKREVPEFQSQRFGEEEEEVEG
jgi:hypothetical protein